MITESPTCGDVGSHAALLPMPLEPISASLPGAQNITSTAARILAAAEWVVAAGASLAATFLLIVRATHAGGLWRDECAAVQLAQMQSWSEIVRNFQHEAFPLLFPATVRSYIEVFGGGDIAMRFFGTAVGIGLIASLWIAARITHRGPPLISTALLGLNTTFLVCGTSVRGYGLGCILIILTFACFVRLLIEPSRVRIAFATLASLAAVQCLLYNLVLVIAIVLPASTIALLRRQPRQIIVYLGILALCMVSFVPYIGPYSTGSAWSVVVEFPVTTRLLWMQLNAALGNPHPQVAVFWYFAFATLVGAALWEYMMRRSKPLLNRDVLLFGSFVAVLSLFGYYEFLHLLSYLPRSWYFLALLGLTAVTLDLLAGALSVQQWLRTGRLAFACVAIAVLALNTRSKITERQTNIDLIATKLAEVAAPSDLIVVAPWLYGISFQHYYHGRTPWMTLPTIADLRVHRYDLYHEKMASPHPIDDVLAKIRQTLSNGSQVWFVGGIKLPPKGRPHRVLSVATNPVIGLDNVDYTESWLEEMGSFVRSHGEHGRNVLIPLVGKVNDFENVTLFVVDGWVEGETSL